MSRAELRPKNLVEDLPLPAALLDQDLRCLGINRGWAEIFDIGRECSGVSFDRALSSISDRWLETCRRAAKGETGATPATRYDRPNGAVEWLRLRACPWRNAEDEIGGAILLVENETERHNAETTLRETQENFRRVRELAQIGWWRVDGAPDILSWASEETLRILCVDQNELFTFQDFLEDVVHPEDRAFVAARWQAAAQGREPYDIEHRILVDGEEKWVRERASHEFDREGRLQRIFGTTQDVTDRKHAQQEAIRMQRRLQAIMDAAPVGLCYTLDVDCESAVGNAALSGQLELPPEENVSASSSDLAAPGRQLRFYCEGSELSPSELPLQRAAAEGRKISRTDIEVVCPSGRRWFSEVSAAPIRGERGEVVGAVAAIVDVTERRQIEQALRDADRQKNDFIAILAHELRNPLAAIRNAAYVLNRSTAPAPTVDQPFLSMTRIVERQVEHLVRLIDDLLDISRIVKGKIVIRKQPVDLVALLGNVIDAAAVAHKFDRSSIELRVGTQPVVCDGDPVRLSQTFSNLLDNAIKFSEPDRRIEIRCDVEDAEAFVCVSDMGVGIPFDELPHIFDLFTQLDSGVDRMRRGLGIGLALVRQLVELHGGKVEAQSAGEGRGSRFTVRLPLRVASAPSATPCGRIARERLAPTRVLVIDDEMDVAESFSVLLKALGVIVRVAHGGEEGLRLFAEFEPEIVFLDLGMPKMDGFQTAARLRNSPAGRRAMLIALTGWSDGQTLRCLHQAGFDRHIAKPGNVWELEAILNAVRNATGSEVLQGA